MCFLQMISRMFNHILSEHGVMYSFLFLLCFIIQSCSYKRKLCYKILTEFTHSTLTIMVYTFGIKQVYAPLNHTCTILSGHVCQNTKSNLRTVIQNVLRKMEAGIVLLGLIKEDDFTNF